MGIRLDTRPNLAGACMVLKRRKASNVKIIFPSTITTFAMVFGFIAILLAMNDQVVRAGYLLMVAIIMDGLDGKVARMTNTASEFGIQYDSLSDLVAFGVAPCVIFSRYFLHQQTIDQVYYLLPIMYLVCGAIRLARFNVTASVMGKTYFMGLPIPAAAFTMAAVPIFLEWSTHNAFITDQAWSAYLVKENVFQVSIGLVIILSLSMISSIRYDLPGTFWLRKFRIRWLNYAVLFGFLALNFISYALFAVAISLYYLLSMNLRALYDRIRTSEAEAELE